MARPRKSTTAMDWLPLAREAPFLNRPADKNFIKTRKTRDWLVRFAFALSDEARPVKQPQQGRMLAKVHVFLQDFIPGGLTGSFSHIHGDDVMRYLLSHSTEHTVSRHKLTKDAEIAFTQLQEWMSGCQNWQAALKRGNVGTGDTPKRRLSIKIPGHYSPAGMMAILIIANPAPKMREMIGKLQIEWMMMQDPKTLKVEGGFWHGINSQNVTNVFLREDYRESEVAFLADYTSIFGKSYTRCKRDIRPFVQPWAQHMELGGELSDSGLDDPDDDPDDSDDSLEDLDGLSLSGLDDHEGHERETGQAHRTEAVHNRPERRMAEAAKNTIEEADPMSTDWNATFLGAVEAALHVERDWEAEPYKDFQDHRRWLIGHFEGQPSNSKNILRVWCRSWADRITAADSDEDRLIVRSLFFRSLQSLRSFRESPSIAHYTDAFMILDMEDEQVESPIPNPSRLPGDLDGASVFEKLGRAVDRALDRSSATVPIEQTIRLMHTRHPIFISEVLTNPITCQYVEDVITLVDYRIKAVIKVLQAIRDVDLLPTLSFEVWKATVSRALKLTNWQLLLLIPHMWNVRAVLTDWQYYVACRKHQSDAEPTALPAAPTEPEPIRDDELVKCDEETRAVLKRLFGSLSKSPSAVSDAASSFAVAY
ncbi:hypothetical protein F5Y18DRAFT_54253 [Xylariaceae sp. FL1019]|nr:hypothetical protein F5Y18DRAFT_54253 [Xylariaceae sp. FL1019]